ncbi:hypothetical protein [Nostoc sp. ChiQUE01b]|uniref:hypothetical protein n=1 Tax=Nostoc sp. ChiQUE01b TaxID=3075376 RepID=UPI002AD4F2CD|nr:hypothetical protein [Nostoc sp. ChiQUE01b]MDZ8237665.1 hypothetical protein [Nostoc sp. ChiQUE01a]MDZ8264335.1 hypothetical protein [Nostoc sp. ChiQUE01b]
MGKRKLKPGNRVSFESHDEQCKPFQQFGIVKYYLYPEFHPNGYIEIVDESGDTIPYGNAAKGIQKAK